MPPQREQNTAHNPASAMAARADLGSGSKSSARAGNWWSGAGATMSANPYFAPNRTAIRLLGRAAQRGVDVRLLLQGRTDMPLVRHAGHGNFPALLASGVRVFEYQSAILHAKTLVMDDYVSVVGSSNLDFRSFYFNAECNVSILDDVAERAMAPELISWRIQSLCV